MAAIKIKRDARVLLLAGQTHLKPQKEELLFRQDEQD